MALYQMLMLLLVSSGLFMWALEWLWGREGSASMRLSAQPGRPLKKSELVASALRNGSVSMVFIMTVGVIQPDWLFREGELGPVELALQSVAVLLLYDLFYYLLHRFPLHQTGYLKRVHAVHHKVRSPTALDSLYLHPLETALGIFLLFLATFLVGPVHIYTFAVIFFVFSYANIVIHSGLALPFAPLRFMIRKHATHHASMRGGNFASLTPLPDLLFGTRE